VPDQDFPFIQIDLDLPPRKRFLEVGKHFREDMIAVGNELIPLIPKPVFELFDVLHWLWFVLNHERYQELQGMVDAIDNKNVTISRMVLVNVFYEVKSWCTSIVAQQEDGTIIHGRNMDFHLTGPLRNMTYRAEFWKDGQPLF